MMATLQGRKIRTMNVLWGAWVNHLNINDKGESIDIIGIYDKIWKKWRRDFPFTIDLTVVVAYEAYPQESGQGFQLSLQLTDGYGINCLASSTEIVAVGGGDSPIRWYEPYKLANVEIKEPGYYELGICIDRQFKQRIPLWVIVPKMIIDDPADGSRTELWHDDLGEHGDG